MSIQEGDTAPAFTLPGNSGTTVSLETLRGRKVVLYFYPKDDTSGCTREAIDFHGLKSQFEEAGAEIVGLSADSPKKHDAFREKHGFDLTLASDEDKKVIEAYGVWVEKSMYGRKYMGIERATFLIDAEGRVARVWHNVKVPGHAEEVLEAARALP